MSCLYGVKFRKSVLIFNASYVKINVSYAQNNMKIANLI